MDLDTVTKDSGVLAKVREAWTECHIQQAIATMDLDTVTKDSGVLAKVREPKLMDMVTYQHLSVLWIRISISNTVGMDPGPHIM